jgi:16S rRNA (guanine966-N2)-methyltransferase
MRVIAGHLRSRRLLAPPKGVRPTPDRVREAIFSQLGDASGRCVLDLFAGTGALGIEALSRGAERVVFVDRAPPSLDVLRRNLDALGLDAGTRVVRSSAARALEMLAEEGTRFDWVFLDPPWDSGELPKVLAALARLELVAARGVVVTETSKRHALGPLESWSPLGERAYGDTVITRLVPSRTGADSDKGQPSHVE